MSLSLFNRCVTVIVFLAITNQCICLEENDQALVPRDDRPVSRDDYKQNLFRYRAEDRSEEEEDGNESEISRLDDLTMEAAVPRKRELPPSENMDGDLEANMVKRSSPSDDLSNIAEANFKRELARASASEEAERKHLGNKVVREKRRLAESNVAGKDEEDQVEEDEGEKEEGEEPKLNYYYPSLGNVIVPMGGSKRKKRNGETDYPGYEMKLHLQKREAVSEANSSAENQPSVFPIKRKAQLPIAIDANSIDFDKPAVLDRKRGPGEKRNTLGLGRRRRSQVKRQGDDQNVSDGGGVEENAGEEIHEQIERLKAKVKREFEEGGVKEKRSHLTEKKSEPIQDLLVKQRGTGGKGSLKDKRESITSALPVSRSKRRLKAVVMDRSVYEKINGNNRFEENANGNVRPASIVKRELGNAMGYNKALFEHQAKLESKNNLSLREVQHTKDRLHGEKLNQKDADTTLQNIVDAIEDLTGDKSVDKPINVDSCEDDISIDGPSQSLIRTMKKRNLDALNVDPSIFENEEFAPVAGYNFEYALKRRKRDAPSNSDSLENRPAIIPDVDKHLNSTSQHLQKDTSLNEQMKMNALDVETMKKELDDLFTDINLSKEDNIIPTSMSLHYWKRPSTINKNNYKGAKGDHGRENPNENYQENYSKYHGYPKNVDVKADNTDSQHGQESSVDASKASEKGGRQGVVIKKQDRGDLVPENEGIVIVKQEQLEEPEGRSDMLSSDLRSPMRRLLALKEPSIVHETKPNSDNDLGDRINSIVSDELQEGKIVAKELKRDQGNSHNIERSDVSNSDESPRVMINETPSNDFNEKTKSHDTISRHEEQWIEGEKKHRIVPRRKSTNDLSEHGDKVVGSQDNEPVVQAEDGKRYASLGRTNLNPGVKSVDSKISERLETLGDDESIEHNQKAVELRNLKVKVGPQVPEVAKLIEQRSKENNKERTQISGDKMEKVHVVENREEHDANPADFNEGRRKRNPHCNGTDYGENGVGKNSRSCGGCNRTDGWDTNRMGYSTNLQDEPLHEKRDVEYFYPRDGDGENEPLKPQRKLYEKRSRDRRDSTYDEQAVQDIFRSGKHELCESDNVRSDRPVKTSSSGSPEMSQSCDHSLVNPGNNLSQDRKLFDSLKRSQRRRESGESVKDNVSHSDNLMASWLEHLIKSQEVEERLRRGDGMESKRRLEEGEDRSGVSAMKSDNEEDVAELRKLRSGVKTRSRRYTDSRDATKRDESSSVRHVIEKRDLGGDQDMESYYRDPQFRNNFHERNVPAYGRPTPDLFNKWDVTGDVHAFSKSLFKGLMSDADESAVAGFDSEGNYISPIVLDRVERLRHRRNRSRRRRRGATVPSRRGRRRHPHDFLFPKEDQVEQFYENRPERDNRELEEEYEGEVGRRDRESAQVEKVRERRYVGERERRDERGWPIANSAASTTPYIISLFNVASYWMYTFLPR